MLAAKIQSNPQNNKTKPGPTNRIQKQRKTQTRIQNSETAGKSPHKDREAAKDKTKSKLKLAENQTLEIITKRRD